MTMNFWVILGAGVVPLITGAIWYSAIFGKSWAATVGKSEEELKKGFNAPLVFTLTVVFGILSAFQLSGIVIHQGGMFSMVMDNPDFGKAGSDVMNDLNMMMGKYGQNFRTFKHGMLHGFIAGITLGVSIIGVTAMFERRSARYILIHLGYWAVTFMIMGGIICQFA